MKKLLICLVLIFVLAACSNKEISQGADVKESSDVVLDQVEASSSIKELDGDFLDRVSSVFLESCDPEYNFNGADVLMSMTEDSVVYGFQFNPNIENISETCDQIMADFTPTFENMAEIVHEEDLTLRVMFVLLDGTELSVHDF